MTYLELQAEVADWMHRTDLASKMDNFVMLSEAMINELLQSLYNQIVLPVSFDNKVYTLPDDYLAMRSVKLFNDNMPVQNVSLEQLSVIQRSGTPVAYSIHSGVLEWSTDIDPTNPLDGEIIYYAAVPSLTLNTTNDVLDNYPLLYQAAMLFQANSYVQDDEQAQKWLSIFQSQLKNINKAKGQYINPQVR